MSGAVERLIGGPNFDTHGIARSTADSYLSPLKPGPASRENSFVPCRPIGIERLRHFYIGEILYAQLLCSKAVRMVAIVALRNHEQSSTRQHCLQVAPLLTFCLRLRPSPSADS